MADIHLVDFFEADPLQAVYFVHQVMVSAVDVCSSSARTKLSTLTCSILSQDPVNSAFHPPGSDPVPEAADPVPLGGLLQLSGKDSADHAGGTHTFMFRYTSGAPTRLKTRHHHFVFN